MVEMDGPSVMADGAAALVCTWCNQTDTDQKCGRTRRSVPLRDAAWAKPPIVGPHLGVSHAPVLAIR
jgi:hypothetical protein